MLKVADRTRKVTDRAIKVTDTTLKSNHPALAVFRLFPTRQIEFLGI